MNALYKAEISKYTKNDGIMALCLFAFWFTGGMSVGILRQMGADPLIAGLSYSVIMVAVCFALVLIKKQGFASIGFRKKNLWPALRLGLLFSIIPLVLNDGILPGIIYGWQPRPLGVILLISIGTLIFAAAEDIVFVGYIQTRLYGIVKNDILAISFGAFLFSIMHISIPLVQNGLAVFNTDILFWLLACFVLHFVMNALFRRYFIIFSTTIWHTLNNVAGSRNIWATGEHTTFWPILSLPVIVLAMGAWALYLRRHSGGVAVEHS